MRPIRSTLAAAALGLAGFTACGDEAPVRKHDWRLRWAAPKLERARTVEVGAGGATLHLDPRRDYRILLTAPVRAVGGLSIVGGRNVVLRGGRITIPYAGPAAGVAERRGLLLEGQRGTVHVEGLLIDNSGGDLSEGIHIAAPDAVVQLQNVRVTGVHARDQRTFTDNHPDLIQTWGGVRDLRVHGFSGSTSYQGFFLRGDRGPVGRVTLSDVNLVGLPGAHYLLWKRCREGYPKPCSGPDFPVETDNVLVRPAPGRRLRLSLKPEPPEAWRDVRAGTPPGGDFVTVAGLRKRYAIDGLRQRKTRSERSSP